MPSVLHHCGPLLLIACALVLLPARPSVASAAGPPLLIAHYYAWFDEDSWTAGVTADAPVQPYRSADRSIMDQHVRQAQAAGIDAFNVAWLGPNNPTDSNLARMLEVAAARGFAASLGFETDSPFLDGREAVVQALEYALARYPWQPGYLRYQGKPVVFFWRLPAIPVAGDESPVAAWRAVRDQVDPDRATIWIGEGDRFEFLEVFDGIHPYSIAWSRNLDQTLSSYAARTRQQARALGAPKLWVATVMPGYDDTLARGADGFVRERGDGAFYAATWQAAVATAPDWIVVTSWNEWVEGTQIEPSQAHGRLYLDQTRAYAASWKGIDAATSAEANADAAPLGGPSP